MLKECVFSTSSQLTPSAYTNITASPRASPCLWEKKGKREGGGSKYIWNSLSVNLSCNTSTVQWKKKFEWFCKILKESSDD